MRYLVLGRTGLLGQSFERTLQRLGLEHCALARPEVDITQKASLARAMAPKVDVIFNCIAWSQVDAAEENEAEAMRVNAEGVSALAERAAEMGACLVHYSTDLVFPDAGVHPHAVDAARGPLGAYGRSKAEGERRLELSGAEYLLIRTSWIYAPWGKNFLSRLPHLLQSGASLRVDHEARGRPTSARYLVAQTLRLLDRKARGIYHVTDAGSCTRFEFACEVAKQTGSRASIEPVRSHALPGPAPRPAHNLLDIKKTEAALGPSIPWTENLRDLLA